MDSHLLNSTITWQRFHSCQLYNYIQKKRYRQVTNGINDENIQISMRGINLTKNLWSEYIQKYVYIQKLLSNVLAR